MRKLLWVGDAGCESGFAKSTHNILEVVRRTWDVAVMGLNYRGEPHDWPYPMWPAAVMGSRDIFGSNSRLIDVLKKTKPDCVVIQNDPWNFPRYFKVLKAALDSKDLERLPDLVGIAAVDGKNCRGRLMNDFQRVVFWTKFGEDEAKLGGMTAPSAVIPLGVDTNLYQPGNQWRARQVMNEHVSSAERQMKEDDYIVVNVNRNQPRKRLDLSIKYFARWVKEHQVKNAYLYLHVAPTGDLGYDCQQLADYFGVGDRLFLAEPEVYHGTSEDWVVKTLQLADVQLSTTQGEGWGLTTLEGMACRIPQVIPDWSALGDWARDGAAMVPCTSTICTPGSINVVGGVMDETQAIKTLDVLYRDYYFRKLVAMEGYELAQRPEYRWENIGQRFAEELEKLFVWRPKAASTSATR